MGLLKGLSKINSAIISRDEENKDKRNSGSQSTQGLDDSDEVLMAVRSNKMAVNNVSTVLPIELDDSPRSTYDVPQDSQPQRPSLASQKVSSKRWTPVSTKQGSGGGGGGGGTINRRAGLGKMKSSSSMFSSFRRKSGTISSENGSVSSKSTASKRFSHKLKKTERSTSHLSNCSSIASQSDYDLSGRSASDGDDKFAAFLQDMEGSIASKKSLKGPTLKELSLEDSQSSSSAARDALPLPPLGLCRPARRPSIVSSVESECSYTDDTNDLDIEESPATYDSKAMLAKLGPKPTSRDLANVAAVCANEYINEHLFADGNGMAGTVDRKKWESIPQYAKSEMIVRKHLGKGSFSDAFEVSVMVKVEEDTKKLDSSDTDKLERRLEAKFKGSFKSSLKKEEKKGTENFRDIDSEIDAMFAGAPNTVNELEDKFDDIDSEIDAMFAGAPNAINELEDNFKDLDCEIDAMFDEPSKVPVKKVTIDEPPKEFQPAELGPRTATRRLRARRQTIDLGVAPPSLSASVCVGSLKSTEVSKTNKTMSRSVTKKQMIYAMKCLRPQIRSNAEQFIIGVEDLVHETAMLASLDHPNIIKLHGRAGCGMGATSKELKLSDGYFILIDKLQDTLEDRIKGWKLAQGGGNVVPSISQVKNAHKLAGALAYLHSKRIMFRDLKPANVGFDSMGELKLFDFGFAIGLDNCEDEDDKPLCEICGTPRYMAPEVGLGKGYGLSADVHSFAMLLWEISSLKKPFAKVKSQSDFQKTVYEQGGRPKLSKSWPPILRDTLKNSWSSYPGERPTMAEVTTSLAAYVKDMAGQTQKKGHHSANSLRQSSVFRRLSG